MGYSFRLTAMVLLYAPSHRQDILKLVLVNSDISVTPASLAYYRMMPLPLYDLSALGVANRYWLSSFGE